MIMLFKKQILLIISDEDGDNVVLETSIAKFENEKLLLGIHQRVVQIIVDDYDNNKTLHYISTKI